MESIPMIKTSLNLRKRLQLCKEAINNLQRDINNGVKVNKEDYYYCQQQLQQARKVLHNEIWKGVCNERCKQTNTQL